MRRPSFIAKQASRPSGLAGRMLTAIMALETKRFNSEVLEHVRVRPGQHILEIGFGHGYTLRRVAAAHPEARFAGIDHAEDMVAMVARRCSSLIRDGRLDIRAGTSESLPWPNASFDCVFAVHTIYFWHDLLTHLSEIRRVLVPGGRVVLGFREKNATTEKALPAEVYNLRSAQNVADLLRAAGFAPQIESDHRSGLWIAEGTPVS
jgi:ubiquinone/menaquinone biosynthesis C-methylase UbiE